MFKLCAIKQIESMEYCCLSYGLQSQFDILLMNSVAFTYYGFLCPPPAPRSGIVETYSQELGKHHYTHCLFSDGQKTG